MENQQAVKIRRIAMWSGPRNISTAMMRSWGNRPDTFVCDEPLYAHYLLKTGLDHPGADEVIRTHENDWERAVKWLTEFVPEGKTVFYQKHMTHHLLSEIDRGWLDQVENVFLIREPAEMLISLAKVLKEPRLVDTGLPQQWEIFEHVRRRTGKTPPIIDAHDVLESPEALLRRLCERLELDFTPTMLSWPAGPRDTDGVWAKHWYDAVWKSTTFQPHRPRAEPIPEKLKAFHGECERIYQELYRERLTA
jgi:hypothetical protein